MKLGPSSKDWLLLFVGAAFALLTLARAVLGRDSTQLGTAGFAVGCTAVLIWIVVRKRRLKEHALAAAVEVEEGVPLRANKVVMLAWTVGTAVAGLDAAIFARGFGAFFWTSVAVAALGTTCSLLVAVGILPRRYLQFERPGLRFAERRFAFVLEWQNIGRLEVGELHGHDVLFIDVRTVDQLLATTSSAEELRRIRKLVDSNRRWYGRDLVILPMIYGADSALLIHSIHRYVSGEPARSSTGAPLDDSTHSRLLPTHR